MKSCQQPYHLTGELIYNSYMLFNFNKIEFSTICELPRSWFCFSKNSNQSGVVSTIPTDLWTRPTPITTPSSRTGLEASRVASAPAPTQRLSHTLGGPATPSRHISAVSAVTARSPGEAIWSWTRRQQIPLSSGCQG